jgi:hypothetical protein
MGCKIQRLGQSHPLIAVDQPNVGEPQPYLLV